MLKLVSEDNARSVDLETHSVHLDAHAVDADETATIQINIKSLNDETTLDAFAPEKDLLSAQQINSERKTDPLIGASIGGHYKIVERIGSGGMGKVYKAIHTLLNQYFAIKFLEDKVGNDEGRLKRFHYEAQAAIKFRHPNIPSIREFGVEQDFPYIVMDYVEGQPLSALIANKTLSSIDICEITAQICDAMQHAHEKKVIHRDIKPSNIMVRKDADKYTAYLLDFGIAKVIDAVHDTRLTGTGEMVGTLRYMSPEQFQGLPASASSDIYSVGCVLFEAFAGQPPFMSNNRMEIVMKHQNAEPPDLPKTAPKTIQRIIFKCLEKVPDRRYQSAASLAADLRRVNSGETAGIIVPRVKSSWKRAALAFLLTVFCLIGAFYLLTSKHSDINSLNNDIAAHPTNASLFFQRGKHYFDNKSFQQALFDFGHAAKLAPKDPINAYYAAASEVELRNFSAALAYADQALKADPNYAEALLIRAVVKSKLGDLEESTSDYTTLLQRFPPHKLSTLRLAALNNRANNFYLMRKDNEALDDAETVLSLYPQDADAHLTRAQILLDRNEAQKALEDVQAAMKEEPRSRRGFALKGSANYKLKNYKEAIDAFNDAILLGDTNTATYLDCARCQLANNDLNSAIDTSSKLIEKAPTSLHARMWRSYFYCKAGQGDRAMKDLKFAKEQRVLRGFKEPDYNFLVLEAAALGLLGEESQGKKLLEECKTKLDAAKVEPEFLELAHAILFKAHGT